MINVSDANNTTVQSVISYESMPDFVGKYLSDISDKISQVILNQRSNGSEIYLTSMKNVYLLTAHGISAMKKEAVQSAHFEKGAPHGSITITFKDGSVWNPTDIIYGRAFDFVQDTKPRDINIAGYDHTVRGEFPQLLDPDHAEEVDKLRKWMQDGHISHYQYDDANPVLPKAGK